MLPRKSTVTLWGFIFRICLAQLLLLSKRRKGALWTISPYSWLHIYSAGLVLKGEMIWTHISIQHEIQVSCLRSCLGEIINLYLLRHMLYYCTTTEQVVSHSGIICWDFFFQTVQWMLQFQSIHKTLLRAAVWIWPAAVKQTLQQTTTRGTRGQIPLAPAPCCRWAQDRCCLYSLWIRRTPEFTSARSWTVWGKTNRPSCYWPWRERSLVCDFYFILFTVIDENKITFNN